MHSLAYLQNLPRTLQHAACSMQHAAGSSLSWCARSSWLGGPRPADTLDILSLPCKLSWEPRAEGWEWDTEAAGACHGAQLAVTVVVVVVAVAAAACVNISSFYLWHTREAKQMCRRPGQHWTGRGTDRERGRDRAGAGAEHIVLTH